MEHDDLVRMVNQICDFFDAYPEDEAVAGVEEHLRKFWDPSMRAQLLGARSQLAQRLKPLARRALEQLAADAMR
jgi:formate dehydrogenase subunit delta